MKYQKIAVISYHTCPLSDEKDIEIGGMNVYVMELSKELAKKGYTIDIFTRQTEIDSPKIVNVSANLRVIHLPAGNVVKLPKKELDQYIPQFIQNFYQFVEGEKGSYDLISAHYYLSGLIGLDIKETYKIPLTITFHTLALMKNLVARSEEEKESIKRIESEILLTQKSDQVIATSQIDAEYIHTLYDCPAEKILILNPGVNHQLFKPMDKTTTKTAVNAPVNSKLILFVGRIEPLKGIDVLLYALKILKEKNPNLNLHLWIIGGGHQDNLWSDELNRLKEIKKLLHISAFVQFLGSKSQEQLPQFYNAADVVIMPSQYESFGITTLEAISCGVPVITTDVTGVSGLFDKTHKSLITSAGNPILLGQKIKSLLTNQRAYARISQQVLNKAQDFSWEKTAEKFIKVWD